MNLSPLLQNRILAAIEGLEANPHPCGVKNLQARANAYRIRVGADHRVIYQIQNDVFLVLIVKIAKRSEAYR